MKGNSEYLPLIRIRCSYRIQITNLGYGTHSFMLFFVFECRLEWNLGQNCFIENFIETRRTLALRNAGFEFAKTNFILFYTGRYSF